MQFAPIEMELQTGLSGVEACRRLQQFGPNSLPSAKPPTVWDRLLRLAREPMLILLLLAAAIYFVLGSMAEGIMLMLFALFSISLMLIQERRSDDALAALKQLAAPLARVRRDGEDIRVPAAELVPGDLVILNEGERVPADGLVLAASHLAVDESLLTGESVPVDKAALPTATAPLCNRVFGSTLIVNGHGVARVTETGARTQTGRLGTSLTSIVPEQTHLQQATGRLVRVFGMLALVVCGGLAVYYGLVMRDWLQGILSGIALGMAMLPEEFPVALAIFLAIGSWRLAQAGVLVRHAAAVEAIGATTCLCVDKTGTITENRMQLRFLDDGVTRLDVRRLQALPAGFVPLLRGARYASRRGGYDPMDLAVFDLADKTLTSDLDQGLGLAREYGLTSTLLAISQVWRDGNGRLLVATKGAPEAVVGLCAMPPGDAAAVVDRAHRLANEGLRVLAVAEADWDTEVLPDDPRQFAFRYLGLLAFEDPVRASVPAAVAAAHAAGVKVKMITGDFPATARTIAGEAGISSAQVVTGDELRDAGSEQLEQWARTVSVFARVRPEQKLQLVDALQANGETVAMTGDGVNDAPALKSADIGIAMGKRGTDVAREAAGIVLLEEDFGRIIEGIRLGRRIFDNLRKVIIYIAAVHIPIAGLGFLPVVFGMPIAIWPLHVVVLEMVVDSMSSLAFEDTPAEPDIMRRPPRRRSESVAALPQLLYGVAQGSAVLVAAFGIYAGALALGVDDDVARAMTILTTIIGNLGLVLSNSSQHSVFAGTLPRPQPLFLPIAAVTLTLIALAIYVPALRQVFHFAIPSGPELAVSVAAALGSFILVEAGKLLAPVRRIAGAF